MQTCNENRQNINCYNLRSRIQDYIRCATIQKAGNGIVLQSTQASSIFLLENGDALFVVLVVD